MKATPCSQGPRGFTLLELLLAFTLGAVVITGASSFLRQSNRLARGQEEAGKTLAAMDRFSHQLATSLRSALLHEDRDDLFFLAGAGPTLLFTTQKGNKAQIVGWTLYQEELYYLTLPLGEYDPTLGLVEGADFVALGAEKYSAALNISLRYFDGEDFQESWLEPATLPQLVELSMESRDGSEPRVLQISLPTGGGRE